MRNEDPSIDDKRGTDSTATQQDMAGKHSKPNRTALRPTCVLSRDKAGGRNSEPYASSVAGRAVRGLRPMVSACRAVPGRLTPMAVGGRDWIRQTRDQLGHDTAA